MWQTLASSLWPETLYATHKLRHLTAARTLATTEAAAAVALMRIIGSIIVAAVVGKARNKHLMAYRYRPK